MLRMACNTLDRSLRLCTLIISSSNKEINKHLDSSIFEKIWTLDAVNLSGQCLELILMAVSMLRILVVLIWLLL